MKALGRMPELILSSPANRAITTAQCIAQQIDFPDADIVVEKDAYCSGSGVLLGILQRLDERYTEVMLVGHNPDMTGLVNMLCGPVISDMPTCAIAMIRLDMDGWSETGSVVGELADYDFPKK